MLRGQPMNLKLVVGGLLALAMSVTAGCKKDEAPEAGAEAGPAAAAAADAGPGYTVVWVVDGGTSPIQAGSSPIAAPVTLRGWFPGVAAKALAAKAALKAGGKLAVEFSAAGADGGAVAQLTVTEPGAGGPAEVSWERLGGADGGVTTLLTTALELEAPKAAAPAPAPAKPTKATKATKKKAKKKKR